MGKHITPPPPSGRAEDVNLREALEERYFQYALSTIMGGPCPMPAMAEAVHRRILYGMHILRLDPGAAFKNARKSSAT